MTVDIAVILVYIIVINIIGLRFAGGSSVRDYFLGNRSVHWGLVCLSIVATETSSLSFISIPGLAYASGTGFLQVSFGYLAGRTLVAVFLLPKYFQGEYETVYEFLQRRFGQTIRRVVSVIFHVTRLFADSVRLFATAIPLTVMTGWDYRVSLAVIGGATFIYTFYGGIRAVIVTDALQLVLYLFCVALGAYCVMDELSLSLGGVFALIPSADLAFVSSGLGSGAAKLFGSYNLLTGVVGGAFLSFASHGTDHLLVQRVLACRDAASAQRAMVASGVVVIFQIALFLLFGLFIKVLLGGRPFGSSDSVVPYFIVNHLPAGLRGLMLAGIFAAAMSTLSSSINSLASSTALDLLRLEERALTERARVGAARAIALFWTLAIVGVSVLFHDSKNPLVEVGLSISSVTYGGVLGIFLLGRFARGVDARAALLGVFAGVAAVVMSMAFTALFWLWYVAVGFAVCVTAALVASRAISWGLR